MQSAEILAADDPSPSIRIRAMLTQQRLQLVQIIELIAMLEKDRPAVAQAVHRAARQLGEGRDREALESLRSAPSEAVASTAWLIELYLLEGS